MRPDLSRLPAYSHTYVANIPEDDLMNAFSIHTASFTNLLHELPPDKYQHRYAADKWTIQEVLQHIIDCERIFAYRAMSIARGEQQPLPGFDENSYADVSKASTRDWQNLVEEFQVLRKSSELLFGSFDEEQLRAEGWASGKPAYVLGIGYTLLGHSIHHLNILKERYLG